MHDANPPEKKEAGKKQKRGFRLGCTSFIYPDHIVPNVQKTGAYFDEIELLVFESQPSSVLPPCRDIKTLNQLKSALDLTYNVHLPVDVSLTASSKMERKTAADAFKQVLDLFDPISPTSFTLHLDMEKGLGPDEINAWQEIAFDGLKQLQPHWQDPRKICIETLAYDPSHFVPLVEEFDLGVCADIGHHLKYDYPIEATFERFKDRVTLIHLHGVDFSGPVPRDHKGLDVLTQAHFNTIADLLAAYNRTVSLEVFNLKHLNHSLGRLDRVFEDIPAQLPALP